MRERERENNVAGAMKDDFFPIRIKPVTRMGFPEARGVRLFMKANDAVSVVKQEVFKIDGVPVDCQQLFHNGELLEDGRTLSSYNIQKDSTIELNLVGATPA